jgi:hypothetical protein
VGKPESEKREANTGKQSRHLGKQLCFIKRQLLRQFLDYLDRAFKIPVKLFVAHDVRKDLAKILDIPAYLTQDLAVQILNPSQSEQEQK